MNKNLEDKIKAIYIECKDLITKHEFSDVLSNEGYTSTEVWDEFAKQINYTNSLLNKQKDLHYLLTILVETKNGISGGTPSEQKILRTLNMYIEQINALLKSYSDVIIGQRWILDYYHKGGGLY